MLVSGPVFEAHFIVAQYPSSMILYFQHLPSVKSKAVMLKVK